MRERFPQLIRTPVQPHVSHGTPKTVVEIQLSPIRPLTMAMFAIGREPDRNTLGCVMPVGLKPVMGELPCFRYRWLALAPALAKIEGSLQQ